MELLPWIDYSDMAEVVNVSTR
ncbi:hypothetical protein CCACVL1_30616 [Corchorus capsularis]|uniref:Uncharacterized protein n=1 Tax=Corchorus capsularis TaxID=210143 RepID=A0A1R3FW96_COCAP|nr:hypothetical protein CCACVL1_30616 [Corchorus capsularis]